MRPLMPLLALAGCLPLSDAVTPTDTAAAPSDCLPNEESPEAWQLSGSLDGPDAVVSFPIAASATRGEGIARATLSFGAFGGSPRLQLLAEPQDSFPVATANAGVVGTPEYATEVFVEWEMRADAEGTVVVDHALASGEPGDYPVPFTLDVAWTPIADCWEDDDRPEDAARAVVGEVIEAFASGTPRSDSSLREGDDDWFRLLVPEDATGLSLRLEPPASIIGRLEVYEGDGRTVLGAVAAVNPGEPLSLDVDAGGEVLVRVFDQFAVEGAWGGPHSPGGVPEPAHLRVPYRLRVDPR